MKGQNEGKLPILTKNQLKRFRGLMVECGYVKTSIKAIKLTDSPSKCQKSFSQVIDYIHLTCNQDDIEELVKLFNFEEICELYAVDNDVEDSNQIYDKGLEGANPIYDKDEPLHVEPNCISDKGQNALTAPNPIYNKVLPSDDLGTAHNSSNEHQEPVELSNPIYDKGSVRGKQKEPLKTAFLVRLDSIQLEKLKALGGNTSEHIRHAVDLYLSSL